MTTRSASVPAITRPQRAPTPESTLARLRGRGLMIVIDDHEAAAPELFAPANTITAQQMGFLIRHTSGFVCATVPAERADALQLPRMVPSSDDPLCRPRPPDYAVTIDAAEGITTGISATDRTRTARLLTERTSTAEAFTRPGHVVPIRVGGRPGPRLTDLPGCAAALCSAAGGSDVAVIAALVHDSGRVATGADVAAFAERYAVPVTTRSAVAGWIERNRLGKSYPKTAI